MAKKKPLFGVKIEYEKTSKGTSIGRNPKKVSSMNKSKRQGRSKKQMRYRCQGK